MMSQNRLAQWWTVLCISLLITISCAANDVKSGKKQPNIVFILTDDQDAHMNSLHYMPLLQKHLISHGTYYKRHYCTVALCCPARANIWTGQAAHNTNVTDIAPPYGGYPKFISQGYNEAYIPVWMQAAGYNTYHIGKFINYHNIGNYDQPFLANWTASEFLLEPGTYRYNTPITQKNHEPPVNHTDEYSTDLLTKIALEHLDIAVADEKPFFLVTAPIAPHADVHITGEFANGTYIDTGATTYPPVSAKRHENMFADVKVPRTPNFNPPEPHGVGWISKLERQNQTVIDYNDNWYRNRLRALQSIDEMVDALVERLEHHGILDDTYIVYTTDNGYHIGQHRLQPSKYCAFQEDTNIPFIVRGPGVSANRTTDVVTSHVDLAPTFLDMIGAPLREDFDGSPIPVLSADLTEVEKSGSLGEHVNIEMWGTYVPEGEYNNVWQVNNSYKALRIAGNEYDVLYTVWCTGDHELYDLSTDPYEINNLYHLYSPSNNASYSTRVAQTTTACPDDPTTGTSSTTAWLERLIPRLDAVLLVLKSCKADSCRNPWSILHPQGNVHSLKQALEPQYDYFYAVQENHVKFAECLGGYFIDNELPMHVKPFNPERL